MPGTQKEPKRLKGRAHSIEADAGTPTTSGAQSIQANAGTPKTCMEQQRGAQKTSPSFLCTKTSLAAVINEQSGHPAVHAHTVCGRRGRRSSPTAGGHPLHAMGCKDVYELDINNALLGADSEVHLALDTITVSADH